MDLKTLTYLVVGATFLLYIGIAIWARASTTREFYVAGTGVHPIANGMATAADWMSAASFISMAGLIAFLGYDASVYLMGWTGGYVLLALLLAPYLRKFGKFTVPEFIGERYYSKLARLVAVICLIVASITYVIGQMKGVGVAFGRFLEVDFETGVGVGMAIVFVYAVLGGMKGITYTQIAQYCVLIFAYTVPAIFIALNLTGNPIPQLGLGSTMNDGSGLLLLDKLDLIVTDLGFRRIYGTKRDFTQYVLIDDVSDDRYSRSAPRDHAFLHGTEGLGCANLGRLGTGIHRHPVHHGSGSWCNGPVEPDGDHPVGSCRCRGWQPPV